jgi:hypothetical protein
MGLWPDTPTGDAGFEGDEMARQTKFTPEKVQLIRNLVECGKSRQEIAELIGVTVGSLQVTCSRLAISLRRGGCRLGNGIAAPNQSCSANNLQPKIGLSRQDSQPRPGEQAQSATAHPERADVEAGAAKLTVGMRYERGQRTTDLPFTEDMIRQLAFQAQVQDMRVGEFLGKLIMAMMKKDLFQSVLEPDQP